MIRPLFEKRFSLIGTVGVASCVAMLVTLAAYAVEIPFIFVPGTSAKADEVNANFAALKAAVDALEAKTAALSDDGTILRISGRNVQIVSGSSATDDNGVLTGLGNLIIGYNENDQGYDRSGSHTLVVGRDHGYSSWGGFVAGDQNRVTGAGASVLGGSANRASGLFAAVAGGNLNVASGSQSAVLGGDINDAAGVVSTISGGVGNTTQGFGSAISGGHENSTTTCTACVVSGGALNVVAADEATVSGGRVVTADNLGEECGGNCIP